MRQILSLVYFSLIDGKSAPEIAEFDASIADPKDKQEMIDKQNAEAMKQLSGGVGMVGPRPGSRIRESKSARARQKP